MSDALLPIGVGLGIVVAGFAMLWVLRILLARAGRRSPVAAAISRHARKPAHLGVVLLACHAALNGLPTADWHRGARHVLYLADIGVLAWGAAACLMII